jgi:hypothetical protein
MSALDELDRTILLCRDYVVEGLADEDICRAFQSLQVLCVSDLRNVSSHSGQTALVTLLSLLGRMGMQVGLDIPEVALLSPQPPLSGSYLCQALTASSGTLVTSAAVRCDSEFSPDLVFVLGDTRIDHGGHALSWRLSGNDWHGVLAMERTGELHAWTAEWPVGSMVSAALAANEAFKFVMRHLPLRDRSHEIFFEPSRLCSWSFESVPVTQEGVHLGQVDVISAGAISQAALYALMRFPRIEMWGSIFDDDLTGTSNLNRNMLTLATDVGSLKVQVVAERCAAKLQLEPVAERFAGKSLNRKLAPRVLVGVDDIPSRWEVQFHAPGWVAVSGTSHFNVSSSAHSPGAPCSGCLHPVDDSAGANPIPTVSFVSFWAGLAMAVRLLREALSTPYSSDRQHLWLAPLRMDLPHAAMWLPVAPRRDCPVHCLNSQAP